MPERRGHDVGGSLVQVVDDDHQRLVQAGERIEERIEERLRRLALGSGEEGERVSPAGPPRGFQQARPELGLGLVGAERQPGHVLRRVRAPLREPRAEQDGLARAGVRREQSQRPVDPVVEQPVEARALDERLRRMRRCEVGADHGRFGRCSSEPLENRRVQPRTPSALLAATVAWGTRMRLTPTG